MERRGDILAKILILGNSQVGKSSILNQFTDGIFSETIGPTLGIDYKINKVTVDGTEIKLQIWDTAGQERFRSITENFYKGAHGIVLVFDLCDKESFATIRNWLKNIYEKAGSNVIVCLVGNKLDLVKKANDDPNMIIDREKFVNDETDVNELLKETPIKYMKASAKENTNIRDAFLYLAKEIKEVNAEIIGAHSEGDKVTTKKGSSEGGSKGCCKSG